MPVLGSATYDLVFDTRQGEVAVAGMETRADQAAASISKSMGMAEKSVASVGVAATEAEGQLSLFAAEGSADFQKVGVAATEMGAAVDRAAAVSSAGAAKTTTAWAAAGARMSAIGKKMSSFGKSMSRTVTLPVVVAAGYGVKQFLDYSQNIKLLQTQAGATAGEMNILRGKILDLAKGTTQGPNELAKAMYRIQSDIKNVGGHVATVSDKLGILKEAANGATMGIGNLDATTYAMVSAMNSGIRGATTATKTMATLSAIVGQGDMHLEDLTAALSTGVIPQSVLANLRLSDLGAAIATMTSRGIPAQKAATWLGTAFSMLMKPTNQMIGAFHKLGMGGMDMAKIMRYKGLGPALDYLNAKLAAIKDPTERARLALAALGGQKSGKALLLLSSSAKDFEARLEGINSQVSNYKRNVAAANAEPINQLKKAWSSVQVALIDFGQVVTPMLVHVANAIASIGNAFSKLPPSVQKVIAIVALLLAAVGPVVFIFGKLFRAIALIGTGVKYIMGVRTAMLGLETTTAASEAIVAGAALGWVAFGAAGVAAIYEIINHIPILHRAVQAAGKWIGNMLYDAAGKVGLVSKGISPTSGSNINRGLIDSVRSRYQRYIAAGMSPKDAAASLAKIYKVTPHDVQVMTGQLASGKPTARTVAAAHKHITSKVTSSNPWAGTPGLGSTAGDAGTTSKKKTKKGAGLLPIDLQIAQVKAVRQGAQAQIAVLQKEQTYLLNMLKHTRSKTKQLAINEELNKIWKSLGTFGIGTGANPDGTAIPQAMKLRVAQAEREGPKALKKTLTAEENYLKGILKTYKGTLANRIKIENELDAVIKKIASTNKKIGTTLSSKQKFDQEMQAYVNTRGSFFNQFASSVFHTSGGGLVMGAAAGGKSMTLNQTNHYNEIPKDRFGLGRELARAAAVSL